MSLDLYRRATRGSEPNVYPRSSSEAAVLSVLRMLVIAVALPASAPALAQMEFENPDTLQRFLDSVMDKIVQEKFDEAADDLTRSVAKPDQRVLLRSTLQNFVSAGTPVYADKVVDRLYGSTGKDVIYKISFEPAFLFIRFVIHKRRQGWSVFNFSLQTENQAPLPAAWPHINP